MGFIFFCLLESGGFVSYSRKGTVYLPRMLTFCMEWFVHASIKTYIHPPTHASILPPMHPSSHPCIHPPTHASIHPVSQELRTLCDEWQQRFLDETKAKDEEMATLTEVCIIMFILSCVSRLQCRSSFPRIHYANTHANYRSIRASPPSPLT